MRVGAAGHGLAAASCRACSSTGRGRGLPLRHDGGRRATSGAPSPAGRSRARLPTRYARPPTRTAVRFRQGAPSARPVRPPGSYGPMTSCSNSPQPVLVAERGPAERLHVQPVEGEGIGRRQRPALAALGRLTSPHTVPPLGMKVAEPRHLELQQRLQVHRERLALGRDEVDLGTRRPAGAGPPLHAVAAANACGRRSRPARGSRCGAMGCRPPPRCTRSARRRRRSRPAPRARRTAVPGRRAACRLTDRSHAPRAVRHARTASVG